MKSTSECVKCNKCEIDDTNKAKIILICHKTGKTYIYGQAIPCDEKITNRKEK